MFEQAPLILQITISGPTASGRSTVAQLLKSVLSTFGIQVEVEDDDLDAMPVEVHRGWSSPAMQGRRLMALAKRVAVQVKTVQTNRSSSK